MHKVELAKPEQSPFHPGQKIRSKRTGETITVVRCEKRVAHGVIRWVVDDVDGKRWYALDCEVVI